MDFQRRSRSRYPEPSFLYPQNPPSPLLKFAKSSLSFTPLLFPPPSQPHPKFTFFPQLPIEIRLHIWFISIQPRTLQITTCESDLPSICTTSFPNYWTSTFDITPRTETIASEFPAILHANPEAREVALKHYHLLTQHSLRSGKYAYINCELDVVVFDHLSALLSWYEIPYGWRAVQSLEETEIEEYVGGERDVFETRLRNLAIFHYYHGALNGILRRFKRLERITFLQSQKRGEESFKMARREFRYEELKIAEMELQESWNMASVDAGKRNRKTEVVQLSGRQFCVEFGFADAVGQVGNWQPWIRSLTIGCKAQGYIYPRLDEAKGRDGS